MIKNLSIQFVTDRKGNKKAVLIPFEEWQELQKELAELMEYRSLKASLKAAFQQVEEIKKGKSVRKSLKEFLNEF